MIFRTLCSLSPQGNNDGLHLYLAGLVSCDVILLVVNLVSLLGWASGGQPFQNEPPAAPRLSPILEEEEERAPVGRPLIAIAQQEPHAEVEWEGKRRYFTCLCPEINAHACAYIYFDKIKL
jgi:hypothetical protein